MNRLGVLTMILTCFITTQVTGQTIDPCDLPSSCFSGDRAGYPGDCQTYYECSFLGVWTNKTCATGQQFDSVSLTCVSTGLATCQPPCDLPTGSTTTISTLAPITCDNSTSGSSCSNQGDMVADLSDCQYYFICLSSTWNRRQCSPGGFIFDIDSVGCVPATEAHCDYRCKTPAPTSPTSPTSQQVTITPTSFTSTLLQTPTTQQSTSASTTTTKITTITGITATVTRDAGSTSTTIYSSSTVESTTTSSGVLCSSTSRVLCVLRTAIVTYTTLVLLC